MSLSNDENQFIESLIKTLIQSKEVTQYDFYMKVLCRLPQKVEIANSIISFFSQCKNESQEKVLILYCKYILNSVDIIDFIKPDDLFSHLKRIITDTTPTLEFKNYLLVEKVLEHIVRGLTTLSPQSIYSSIISWGTKMTPLALSALSIVYDEFSGNTLSYLITCFSSSFLTNNNSNNSQNKSYVDVAAFYIFFSSNNLLSLKKNVSDLLFDKRIPESSLQSYNPDKKNNTNKNDNKISFFDALYYILFYKVQEKIIPFIALLGSLFTFIPPNEACDRCLTFKKLIENCLSDQDLDVRLAACDVLVNLPSVDDHPNFGTALQLFSFSPLFIQSVNDLNGEMVKKLIEFIEPRSKGTRFNEWIISLFTGTKPLSGLFAICCHFNLFDPSSNPDYENFIKAAFPKTIDIDFATAVCYAVSYLSNSFVTSDLIINETSRFLVYSLENFYEKLNFNANYALNAFTRSCIDKHDSYFLAMLNNITLCQSEKSITKVVASISVLITEKRSLIPPKITKELFVEIAVPSLIRIVTAHDDFRDSLIYLLQVIYASVVQIEISCDDYQKYHGKPLSFITDDLIPLEYVDDIHSKILDKIDTEKAANIVAICLDSSNPNPESVMTNTHGCQPFDNDIFTAFYENAARKNVTQAIDRLNRVIRDFNIKSNQSFLNRVLFSIPLIPSSARIPSEAIYHALRLIIIYGAEQLKETHIQALFSIFETIYEETKESELFLREICKTRKKVNIPNELIPKILKSPIFVHCLPDFMYMIDESIDFYNLALTNWFNLMEKDKTLIDESKIFVESIMRNNKAEFFSKFMQFILNQKKKQGALNFCSYLSKLTPKQKQIAENSSEKNQNSAKESQDILPILPDLFQWLAPLLISQEDKERHLAKITLSYLFHLESDETVNEICFESLPFGQIQQNSNLYFNEINKNLHNIETCITLFNVLVENSVLTALIYLYSSLQTKGIDFIKKQQENDPIFHFLHKHGISETIPIKFYCKKILRFIYNMDMKYCLERIILLDMNQFTYDFCIENCDLQFVECFLQLFRKFRIDDDSSVKKCAFKFPFAMAENTKIHEIDFLLIWLALLVSVDLVVGYDSMSNNEFKNSVDNTSKFSQRCFERFGITTRKLIEADFDSYESISNYFASCIIKFNEEQLMGLLKPLSTTLKLNKSDFAPHIVSIAFMIAGVYKNLIQLTNATSVKSAYCSMIGTLSLSGKDDSCRMIFFIFEKMFTTDNFGEMTDQTITCLLQCGIRSLVNPAEEMIVNCTKLLCKILTIVKPEEIEKAKNRIFDLLKNAFELSQEVGLDLLLDGVAAYVAVEPSIQPFLSMSELSLPRLLILSVNDSEVIREKSKKIMCILASTSNDDMFISHLIQKIGPSTVDFIARFFVNWAEKNTITGRILAIIGQFAETLKDEPRALFITKVTPLLVPIVNNIDHPLQHQAIDIFSILLGVTSSQ